MLSKYFTETEATHSQAAARFNVSNVPSPEVMTTIIATAKQMDVVRELLGHPVYVSSWYRSEAVNDIVGGSASSAHMKGCAVDFVCPRFGSPRKIAEKLKHELVIPFDQIIVEFPNSPTGGWVHISFDKKARQQVLETTDGRVYK